MPNVRLGCRVEHIAASPVREKCWCSTACLLLSALCSLSQPACACLTPAMNVCPSCDGRPPLDCSCLSGPLLASRPGPHRCSVGSPACLRNAVKAPTLAGTACCKWYTPAAHIYAWLCCCFDCRQAGCPILMPPSVHACHHACITCLLLPSLPPAGVPLPMCQCEETHAAVLCSVLWRATKPCHGGRSRLDVRCPALMWLDLSFQCMLLRWLFGCQTG